jgi:hypothetical protein
MEEADKKPSEGFPTHPHREAEIFSYIVSGELSHKDSMGNIETMKRGDVQMTSGGTGISHSEFNANKKWVVFAGHAKRCWYVRVPVHFLQIWALPNQPRLKPQYFTRWVYNSLLERSLTPRHYTDADKANKWAHIVAPVSAEGFNVVDAREGDGPTPVSRHHTALNKADK